MTIEWSLTAIAHLASIYEYIARDSAIYAQQTIESLVNRAERLSQFPRSGRALRGYHSQNVRELVVNPYRIIYQLSGSHIQIVGVLHGRQRFHLDE